MYFEVCGFFCHCGESCIVDIYVIMLCVLEQKYLQTFVGFDNLCFFVVCVLAVCHYNHSLHAKYVQSCMMYIIHM